MTHGKVLFLAAFPFPFPFPCFRVFQLPEVYWKPTVMS